uniref:DNA replication licensing factor MCM2 (Minichromosome maintenance protein 2 homolog) n=1 Tax=Schistosoma japonicum TaxID=6182 RepID=C1LEJ3_SCHJA|nr:DNA replication licensing factor MCM2 (Minichromosome maintenance protein 2 homolog) [Schistosoma japonicum]
MLARFVVGSHMRHHPNMTPEERISLNNQLSERGVPRSGSYADIQPLDQNLDITECLEITLTIKNTIHFIFLIAFAKSVVRFPRY